jgi:CRP/FNR family transcriptional regulator, cyclic AMP receptor protein
LFGGVVARSVRKIEQELLKRHFLIGKLGNDEISMLLDRAHVEYYDAGQSIFSRASPGDSILAVLRGGVKISILSADGKEIVLNVVQEGELFGEIAFLDGRERTADATAMTDCELLVVYRRDFLPLIMRRPDLCMALMETLCERLRQTSVQVEDLAFNEFESRVARTLLRLAGFPRGDQGCEMPVVRITQQELGNMVGGARETINRHLKVLHLAGLIRLGKGSISLLDVRGLQRVRLD